MVQLLDWAAPWWEVSASPSCPARVYRIPLTRSSRYSLLESSSDGFFTVERWWLMIKDATFLTKLVKGVSYCYVSADCITAVSPGRFCRFLREAWDTCRLIMCSAPGCRTSLIYSSYANFRSLHSEDGVRLMSCTFDDVVGTSYPLASETLLFGTSSCRQASDNLWPWTVRELICCRPNFVSYSTMELQMFELLGRALQADRAGEPLLLWLRRTRRRDKRLVRGTECTTRPTNQQLPQGQKR